MTDSYRRLLRGLKKIGIQGYDEYVVMRDIGTNFNNQQDLIARELDFTKNMHDWLGALDADSSKDDGLRLLGRRRL